MNLLPFSKLLISEKQLKIGVKYATGLVEDWESLMYPETIELLRKSKKHVYCFIAFNKKVDEEIFNYIKTGALGAESGDEIVILYTINKIIKSPRYIENDELTELLTMTNETNSTIEILKAHFPDGNALMFPGILIFDNTPYSSKSVYVPLSGNEKLDKITYFRKVLGILKKSNCKNQKRGQKSHR